MYYRINSIESKDPNTYNIFHDLMRGRRCQKPNPHMDDRCWIVYETVDGNWHHVMTSKVSSFETKDNGDMIIETANTLYYLTKEQTQ